MASLPDQRGLQEPQTPGRGIPRDCEQTENKNRQVAHQSISPRGRVSRLSHEGVGSETLRDVGNATRGCPLRRLIRTAGFEVMYFPEAEPAGPLAQGRVRGGDAYVGAHKTP